MTDTTDPAQENRRAAFEVAAAIDDQTERLLEAAAVVAEELAVIGREPIIVGGLAVAYWAEGVETTGDIDVAMPDHPALDEHLELLGLLEGGAGLGNCGQASRLGASRGCSSVGVEGDHGGTTQSALDPGYQPGRRDHRPNAFARFHR